MIRRFSILGMISLILIGTVAESASATAFNYQRNNSLVWGSIRGEAGAYTYTPWYRAGSGSGTNACQTNNWIPTGTYSIPFHDDNYAGSLIQGRVWRLSDYQCLNGVRRTELFVHSEETSSQDQYCPTGYDDKFCWEGPDDYYSNGCIKVARMPLTGSPPESDLRRLDEFHHYYPVDYLGVGA